MGRPYKRSGGARNRRRGSRSLGDPVGGSRARSRSVRRYPWPGDSRAALRPDRRRPWRTSSAEGAITLPDGVPATVTVERPRQKGHGDYATNVALQLAKKAGTSPRDFADLVAERARRRRRHRRRRHRRAGLPQHHASTPAPRARSPRRSSRRAGVRQVRGRLAGRRSTSSSSRPTRPARCTSAAPAGPRSATRSRRTARGQPAPRSAREYYFNDHGAQIDRFSRVAAGPRAGPAGARGRLRRRSTSPRSPPRSSPTHPEVARPARRGGAGGLPAVRRRA